MVARSSVGTGRFARAEGRRGLGRWIAALVASSAVCAAPALATTIYVDDSAPPGGNGLSWSAPYRHLADAIAFAAVPANGVTEIRIGGGTYRTDRTAANPNGTGLSTATFQIVNGVTLRGGYAGFGAADPGLRDTAAFPTILSADIGVVGVVDDNSYNVLRANAGAVTATLDGLVIRDGNADGVGPGVGDFKSFGGGIYVPNGALTIVDCVITANRAQVRGGAIEHLGGALTVIDSDIVDNASTTGTGGAIAITGAGPATFTGVVFADNVAKGVGGALFVFGRPASFAGCSFSDNVSTGPGGGYVSDNAGGAIWSDGGAITLQGAQNLFVGNSATNGGAIALRGGSGASLTASAARFEGNEATSLGGAIHLAGSGGSFSDCEFVANAAAIDGGAIFESDAFTGLEQLVLLGCSFDTNGAGRLAGAVHVGQNVTVAMTGCAFAGNLAGTNQNGGSGGALLFQQGTVAQSTFTGNAALGNGVGGAVTVTGAGTIVDSEFIGNSAADAGGAVRLAKDGRIRDSLFAENSATFGGAIHVPSGSGPGLGPWITRCTIRDNVASQDGGGISVQAINPTGLIAATRFLGNSAGNVGGAVSRAGNGATRLVSSLLSGNGAAKGGALAATNSGTLRTVASTIVGNQASIAGGGAVAEGGLIELSSCILWANQGPGGADESGQIVGPTNLVLLDHCCVQGWTGTYAGATNFGLDPQLIAPAGADGIFGTEDDDPAVAEGSPCDDAGFAGGLPEDGNDLDGDGNLVEPSSRDLLGQPRVMNLVMDIGSAERQVASAPGVFVGPSGGSWFVAEHWAGGAVPDASTDVLITTSVVIGAAGAVADEVVVNANGQLTVQGAGSLAATSLFIDGGSTLSLQSTASAIAAQSITFAAGAAISWNGGTVSVGAGGSLVSAVPLSLGCGSQLCELRLLDGASAVAPTIQLCVRATLRGLGVVDADVTNGGTVAPGLVGETPGTLAIAGDYAQSAGGKLLIELAGYAPDAAFDALAIGGAATLGGQLSVQALSTAAPTVVAFRIIEADAVSGAFGSVVQTDPPGAFVAGLRTLPDAIEVGVTIVTPRLFVAPAGASGALGTSWSDALADLQTAIVAIRLAPPGAIDEVWVAEGVYLPTELGDTVPSEPARSAAFRLPGGVAYYGGFAGTEATIEERDPAAHPTVLTGDALGNDDGADPDTLDDNLMHVLRLEGVGADTLLDGFVIRGGNAEGGGIESIGGGALVLGSSPVLRQCRFESNRSIDGGAATAIVGGGPLFDACAFESNRSADGPSSPYDGLGGAILVREGSVTVVDSTFLDGQARFGGAIRLEPETSASVVGSVFEENVGFFGAAAISSNTATLTVDDCVFRGGGGGEITTGAGGAIAVFRGVLTLSDSLFEENVATAGGALALSDVTAASTITGTTFQSNEAAFRGGALSLDACAAVFSDCQFIGNAAAVDGGAVNIAQPGANGEPLFVGCVFAGNAAAGRGGAFAIVPSPNESGPAEAARLVGWLLGGNEAAEGGAAYVFRRALTLSGTTLEGNVAADAAGVRIDGGTLRGDASASDGAIRISGSLRPGIVGADPIGTLVASGGLLLEPSPSGQPALSVFDLASDASGIRHDAIDLAGGVAELSGLVIVKALDAELPLTAGERIPLVSGGRIAGGFDAALLPSAGPGLGLVLEQSAGATEVVVVRDEGIQFVATPQVEIPGEPKAWALVDLDGDGDRDVVVLARPSSGGGPGFLVTYRNEGVVKGAWQGFTLQPGVFTAGVSTVDLAVADFDGDGYLDAAVTNLNGTLNLLLNDGTSGFAFEAPVSTALGGELAAIVAIELGGSSAPDLLVVKQLPSRLQILVNTLSEGGGFTLAGEVPAEVTLRQMEAADLDGDGSPEVVVAGTGGPQTVGVFSTSGGLGSPSWVAGPNDPTGLSIADVDGDGALDLVVSSGAPVVPAPEEFVEGSIHAILALDGAFLPSVGVPVGSDPGAAAVFDADGDGDGDVAVLVALPENQTRLRIARNAGAGATLALAQVNDIAPPGQGRFVVAEDLDGDGQLDLVVAADAASGGVAGGTSALTAYLNAGVPGILGDLDGDGVVGAFDLAILLGSWGSSGGIADLDRDGTVGSPDLAILLGAWSA